MLPSDTPRKTDRRPSWVAVVALVLASLALLLIALDGACRPEPVPVDAPHPTPITDAQLRAADPSKGAP